MAVLLNGTNGLIQAYDYQTPTTGFSYTFAAGTQTLVMNPAGTLATGTITMPASPSDGMTITISSTQQITALTLSGNTGQTIVGGVNSLAATQAVSFIYRSANTSWFPMTTQVAEGNGPAFSATQTVGQAYSGGTFTKVQFSTEVYDTANCYDPTTNYRFTPNVAGYYLVTSIIETNGSSFGALAIYKNGAQYKRAYYTNPSIGTTGVISTFVYMNGTTDYVEAYVATNNSTTLYATTTDYEFSAFLARAA